MKALVYLNPVRGSSRLSNEKLSPSTDRIGISLSGYHKRIRLLP